MNNVFIDIENDILELIWSEPIGTDPYGEIYSENIYSLAINDDSLYITAKKDYRELITINTN